MSWQQDSNIASGAKQHCSTTNIGNTVKTLGNQNTYAIFWVDRTYDGQKNVQVTDRTPCELLTPTYINYYNNPEWSGTVEFMQVVGGAQIHLLPGSQTSDNLFNDNRCHTFTRMASIDKEGLLMNEFSSVFKMQIRHMASRSQFKFVCTFMLVLITYCFCETCNAVYGLDKSELYSAADGWIGHVTAFYSAEGMNVFYFLLIFMVSSLVFADSMFINRKKGICNSIVTRCSQSHYIMATSVLSFLGAFFVILIPLLLSQLLAFLIFPINSTVSSACVNYYTEPSWQATMKGTSLLFPALYLNHPYLSNLLYIFYSAFCAGVFALLSFVLSFYIRRSHLLVVGIPTIILLTLNAILPHNYCVAYYLCPTNAILGRSPLWFVLFPLIVFVPCCLIILVKIRSKKDVLL